MKRIIIKFIFLTSIVHLPVTINAAGQENDSLILSASYLKEKIYLFTDRTLYAAGETVLFRVFNMSNDVLKSNNWSRVIYVELINSHNTPVAQGKYLLSPEGATGQIIIPDTLTTGSCYIRAYTNWMRNYPPSAYFHAPLAIVNPYKVNMSFYANLTVKTDSIEPAPGFIKGITCTTDKSSYGKREKVKVQLKEVSAGISPDGYCVTVIKNEYLDTDYCYAPDYGRDDLVFTSNVLYSPETKGLSLSGYAVSGQERKALADARIYLTLMGNDPDCFEYIIDDNGRIHFSIPNHTGSRDVLITVDSKKDEEIQIIMDDEFSREYADIPASTVDFFQDRQDLIGEIMVNSQVKESFKTALRDTLPAAETEPAIPFYGNPDFRYRTDDYIMLPNLEEFFYELIHSVMLVKVKKTRYLTVVSDFSDMSFYPPLILLDYVPVLDVETILPVSPQRIEYIDIINTVYIRGNIYYGGIINLVSKDGDRAGVELPSGSSFIHCSTFYESEKVVYPDYGKQRYSDKVPDLRTTLYWIPQIDIAADGSTSIEFYTSDITGEYTVIIRGVTKDGRVVRGTGGFSVK